MRDALIWFAVMAAMVVAVDLYATHNASLHLNEHGCHVRCTCGCNK